MKRILIVMCWLAHFTAPAQRTAKSLIASNGQRVGFYQYLPPGYHANVGNRYPVIIFLHGIGEKGRGTEPDISRVNCCGIPHYINLGNTMTFNWNGKTESFLVLFPQLASKFVAWQHYYINEMIKYATQNLWADTNRIFLTGLSLGGGGTWTYASSSVSNARKLAGIVPVVSPCYMSNGCNIANANLPVLAIHALDDKDAPYTCTTNAIKSIVSCGAAVVPNAVLFPTGGHYVWVKRAYDTSYNYINPNIFEWMLAQNKSFAPNKKPIANAGKDTSISISSGNAFLDGSSSYDPDGKIVRYIWTKVSGPTYGMLANAISATPQLSGLTYAGVYKYELKVVDDRAEWTTDTLSVKVVAGILPPVPR